MIPLYTHYFHDSGEIDVILSSWVLVASNRRLVIQFLVPHFSWSFLFIALPYSRGTVLTWRDDLEQVARCKWCDLKICSFTRRTLLSSIPQRVHFRNAECYVQISEIPVIPNLKVNKILDQLKAFQLFCRITYGRHKPHLTLDKQANCTLQGLSAKCFEPKVKFSS